MKTQNLLIAVFTALGMSMQHAVIAGEKSAADLDRHLCSVCHGYGGTTTNELFPQLAKQPREYLVAELKEFKDHNRYDENAKRFMWGVASRLSDSEIEALADFYSAQEVVHLGKIKNQAQYDRGQNIFTKGIEDKGVPACQTCHGEKAEGHDSIARLGGQNENYLIRQLRAFHQNARETGHIMNFVAGALTEDDLQAMAHFLQAQ
jgi:cytochrome c553